MALLTIVGSGPGAIDHLTAAAREALCASSVIVGYDSYIDLLLPLLEGKQIISTGMMQEVQRCREAIRLSREGESVALVSGGDSGIYGMAGLVLELLDADVRENPDVLQPDVLVIPGISAIQAGAALLGAPLMHDFAVISLSDLLTPWQLIRKRLDAAARADFVISIFNPRSRSRLTQLVEARDILLTHRPPETPAGIVRAASRTGQTAIVTTLGQLLEHEIDMTCIVFIGNASSYIDRQGRIVTPRGYAGKYGHEAPASEASVGQEPLPQAGAVMVCGTASDVGKSVITAGLCRYLKNRGMAVVPFKSQNMALNSCVTPEGGEIGRAQAVQAQACGIEPHTDMNPVLLKPNSDTGSQIIVQGRPVGNMTVREYDKYKPTAFVRVKESYERLRQAYRFIVIEGAGSIAEINLKNNDIANLKIALMARCPVILIADIDRGGVFAQIIGTVELLEPHERVYIKGFIINKFRGDPHVLTPGIDFIEERTGIPVLGVLPWFADINLPAEDSMALDRRPEVSGTISGSKKIHIGIIRLPRISNFTDFDPLRSEPDVQLSYVESPQQLAELDVLIIPGSKSTIADLRFLMELDFFDAITNFKGHIVGICGGFQMLGTQVRDPDSVESAVREAAGLDLLSSETVILPEKETHQTLAYLDDAGLEIAPQCSGVLAGYEIHMGRTHLADGIRPFARIFKRGETSVTVEDGAVSNDGRIFGTYLHGIFENTRFRTQYLDRIRCEKGMAAHSEAAQQPQRDPFDRLADHLEEHLDMTRLMSICGLARVTP